MEFNLKNRKYTLQVGFGQGLTRGVVILAGISIVVFIITQSNRDLFYPLFGFVPSYALERLMLWQFITAIFMHSNVNHLVFNLFTLYMFGGAVEKALKTRGFFIYFLICGAGGFILTTILWLFGIIQNSVCVGASAAIYGLLVAFSLLYPNQKVLLYFIAPMQAKWLALIFGCFELLFAIKDGGISQIGHLGGIIAGLLYFIHVRGIGFIKGSMNA